VCVTLLQMSTISGKAKIGKMRFAFCIQQNVSRLDVPMRIPCSWCVMNRARDLGALIHSARSASARAGHFVELSRDEFHAEVAGAIPLIDS